MSNRAPMTLNQALALAALVLQFESETGKDDAQSWRRECAEAAELLRATKRLLLQRPESHQNGR